MKYGRTKCGNKWHSLTNDGQPLCVAHPSTERPMTPLQIVEFREGPVTDIGCGNCATAMRRKGRQAGAAKRAGAKAAARERRDTYEPRFKETLS